MPDVPVVPNDMHAAPVDTSAASAGTPVVPADVPVVPADTSAAPTGTPVISAEMPTVPTGAPVIPSDQRKHVHNSYIWLGTIRVTALTLFIVLMSSMGSLAGVAAELQAKDVDMPGFAAGLVIGLVCLGVVVLAAVVLLVHVWAYKHLYYEVGAAELTVYSGIFSKKRVHVPYARIQTVDQKASLLQRIFGVCNVAIDTAGGASNKAVVVPYLTKQDTDRLRIELYSRKRMAIEGVEAARGGQAVHGAQTAYPSAQGDAQVAAQPQAYRTSEAHPTKGNITDVADFAWDEIGGVFAGDRVFMEGPSYEIGLSVKELIFTGASNSAGAITAIILALCSVVGFVGSIASVPVVGDFVMTGVSWVGEGAVMGFIGWIAILSAVCVWAFSVLATCVQYGGFKTRRRGSRIEVERGLLQHQTESIDIARVQSVVVKKTLVRRILGYSTVMLGRVSAQDQSESSGSQNAASRGIVVHPFIKDDQIEPFLAGIVPEFDDMPAPIVPVAPVALRRGIVRRVIWQGAGFWVAIATAVAQVVFGACIADVPDASAYLAIMRPVFIAMYVVAALLFAAGVVSSVLWAKESAMGCNRLFATVRNGGFSIETVCVPRQKIQFGYVRSNPFQRAAGTRTVVLRTAEGVGGTTTRLIDVPIEVAERWLEWLKPGHGGAL